MTCKRDDKALDIFTRDFVERKMSELGQEMSQPIDVVVLQLESGRVVQSRHFSVACGLPYDLCASAEVRVIFRIRDVDKSFFAQAILNNFAEGTGFSGFDGRGRIRPNHETEQLRVTGFTYRYNVWEWDREFHL